jgi:SAM-dependent methyltransferase
VTHVADERVLEFPGARPAEAASSWPHRTAWPALDLRDAFEEEYFASPLAYGGRYDRANPPHKLASYLHEVRDAKPTGTLLDVGCAFGRFLQVAAAHYACEGLDTSRYALARARQEVPAVTLYHSAIQDFATDRRYDVITCFDVLEHVPLIDRALARLRALLAPDGVLIAAVPVYDTPFGWAVGMIDRDPTHLHRWSRRAWLERLQDAGLSPLAKKGIVRIPLPGHFVHAIGKQWWPWAAAILVVCARGTGGAS